MNEELKVIISAEIGKLQQELGKANKEVSGFTNKANKNSTKFGKAMTAIGNGAKKAAGVVKKAAKAISVAITAATAALTALNVGTNEIRDSQAKLDTAFKAAGGSAEQASETFKDLFRFMGDTGAATEAAQSLAKLTTDEKALAEYTTALQGVYATFGKTLPIESLAEAANETAKVGKVTGTFADALNWAGVSEDAFNEALAATNNEAERELLIRNTLNSLYSDAALLYEQTNKDVMAQREAQLQLNTTLANLAKTLAPVTLALTNLANVFLTSLAPAINAVVPYIATFINYISLAVQWVTALVSALVGSNLGGSVEDMANNAGGIASGFNGASKGAAALNNSLGKAEKTAEKMKKSLAGFDELNVLSSNESSAASGGGASGGAGGLSGAAGGITLDTTSLTDGLKVSQEKVAATAEAIKTAFKSIGDFFKKVGAEIIEYLGLFSPSFDTLKAAASKLKEPFIDFGKSVGGSLKGLLEKTIVPLLSYLTQKFVPGVVNSVTTNLVPVFADILPVYLEEWAKTFEWACGIVEDTSNSILIPTIDAIKNIFTDATETIKEKWSSFGAELLTNFQTAMDNIRSVLTGLYEGVIKPITQYVVEAVMELWDNHLSGLWANLLEFFGSLGNAILTIWNNFLAPFVNWIIENVVPVIVTYVTGLIDMVKAIVGTIVDVVSGIIKALSGLLDFITGVFSGNWEKAWNGIKKFFAGIWDAIKGLVLGVIEYLQAMLDNFLNTTKGAIDVVVKFFEMLWQQVKKIFTPVVNFFVDIFTKAWNGIKKAFSAVGSFFANVWNTIKNAFSAVGTFFKNTFTNAWNGVKNVFNNVKSFFSGIWDSIKGVFSDIGTKISDAISKSVKTAINNVLGGAAKIINGFIDAINFAIDVLNAVPGVSITKLNKLEVPKLATGGIVDKATLAVVGERGKEAVLPLENNTEWMDKLADRLAQRNNSPSRIVLMLDGKELGWASINSINDITRQTGNLQLTMA